jgi:hypothetical protein
VHLHVYTLFFLDYEIYSDDFSEWKKKQRLNPKDEDDDNDNDVCVCIRMQFNFFVEEARFSLNYRNSQLPKNRKFPLIRD